MRKACHCRARRSEVALGLLQRRARFVGPRGALAQPVEYDGAGREPGVGIVAARFRSLFQTVVDAQAQDFGEHLLPLGRSRHRELVGAALHEERAVDERLVVHVDQAFDCGFRGADGVAGDGPEFVIGDLDGEFEGALRSAPSLGVAPRYAVALAAHVEDELDAHLGLAVVQQLFLPLAARFAPERPRNRVEQRGFAVAVGAADAGDVDVVQHERGRGVAIGEEIGKGEADRQHVDSRGSEWEAIVAGGGRLNRGGGTDRADLPRGYGSVWIAGEPAWC